MPNIVTGIASRYDGEGNYRLEVTADDGSTFEVLIPPKMEAEVRLTIQENVARRFAQMSGAAGYTVLDVSNCEAANTRGKGDRILVVATKQLGAWGLRVSVEQAQKMIACLGALLRSPGQGGVH